MGTLSKLHRRGSIGKATPNRDPLRKIVREYERHGRFIEVLECGHEQPQRRDFIGPTNAVRRRCCRCRTDNSDR